MTTTHSESSRVNFRALIEAHPNISSGCSQVFCALFAFTIAALMCLRCASAEPMPLTPSGETVFSSEETTRLAWLLMSHHEVNATCEVAAFIVRDADGHVGLLNWPSRGACNEAEWRGRIPSGAIGVLHTHTAETPRPSLIDIHEAARTRLPFVVASSVTLCIADVNEAVICRSLGAPGHAANAVVAATPAGSATTMASSTVVPSPATPASGESGSGGGEPSNGKIGGAARQP